MPSGAVLVFTFDRPTFYHQFNKQYVKDLSGNRNPGTLHGTKMVAGKVGDAVSFNRTDFIECSSAESLKLRQAMSISVWIKARSIEREPVDYIVSKDDWAGDVPRGFVLRGFENGAVGLTFGNLAWYDSVSPQPLPLQEWHHLAVTYDGAQLITFVDAAVAHFDSGGRSDRAVAL